MKRFRSVKPALVLGATALLLALAVPAMAATTVSWKTSTKRTITVRKGSTVKLVWGDSAPHNVAGFHRGIITGRGKSWSHRFTRSATLLCDLHPGMRIRVNVR